MKTNQLRNDTYELYS